MVVTVMSATACGGPVSAVRDRASSDMSCSQAQTNVVPVTGYTGLYYVEGCKQLRRYTVDCNALGICLTPKSVDVLALVQKQAGFDLKCDASSVAVERINTDTFGAQGCDRRASYVLLCRGQDCRVVQNTQSQ